PILEARPAVVSFVTVAELEYGARLADWATIGSSGWSTRLAGPRSSGLGRISPRYMPRCVPGASGRVMAWARRNTRRIAGVAGTALWLQALWSPTIGSSPTSTTLSYGRSSVSRRQCGGHQKAAGQTIMPGG